ncbi:MAG: HEAT repeat domain-containing protein [Gemmataceae bacterium]
MSPPAASVRTLLLALALTAAAKSSLPAGPFPKDPVEQFRQALLLENNKSITYKGRMDVDEKALELALDFRRRNLEKTAQALKTTSDLSRALLLIDWPRPPRNRSERDAETKYDRGARDIERKVREDIAGRFVKEVQATIRTPAASADDYARKIATANLVGETVAGAGDLQDQDLLLYTDLKPLAEDLATLVTARSPAVREAAARALGQFPNSPRVAAEALKKLLGRDNPESTRKAAADGLLTLAQTVSSSQPIRGSEPGVSVRETRRPGRIFTLPEVAALVQEVAKAAGTGLGDPDTAVRRQLVNALRQAAESLTFEVKVLLPVSSSEVALPPAEREWSKDERERVEDQRKAITEDTKVVLPSLRAFRDQGAELLRASMDADPAVRLGARRTLDALAQTRDLLIKLRGAVPMRGGDKGVMRRDPVTAPPAVAQVAFLQKDDKGGKEDAVDDGDDDPVGTLLRQVGEGLVRGGFRDPTAPSRRAALEAMEAMGPGGAQFIPQLVERLKDDDLFVRWIAARALGKQAPREAALVVPGLVCVLDDVDLDPRIAAARALGQYGADAAQAVPALSARLLKGDAEFRIAVMKALDGIGTDSQPALPNLARALRDTDPRVRTEAATVIGRFGALAKDYIEPLRQLTTDPDSDVRKAASAAILMILSK